MSNSDMVNFRLALESKRALQHLGVDTGLTLSEVLRRLVAAFLAMSEEEQQATLMQRDEAS